MVGSIIDHFLTDMVGRKYQMAVVDVGFSDHRALALSFPIENRVCNDQIVKRVLNHEAVQQSRLWEGLESLDTFEEIVPKIREIISENTITLPVRRKRGKHSNAWISPEIIEMIKKREKYFRYSRRFPNNTDIRDAYLRANGLVKAAIRHAKKNYLDSRLAAAHGEPRKLWSCVREIVYNSHTDNSLVTQESLPERLIKSNNFNDYFVSVGESIAQDLAFPDTEYFSSFGYDVQHPSILPSSSLEVVGKNILELKLGSAAGYDGISNKFVKKYADKLVVPIVQALNKCWLMGFFPDCLKIASVTPIHKSGDRNHCSNYRPISVLTAFNMLAEEELRSWLSGLFATNGVIHPLQFGFMKNSSTLSAAAHMTHFLSTHLDKGDFVAVIFLDIQKAFDCVNHQILLKKLEKLGLSGRELRIIESYLADRRQFVKVGDAFSSLRAIMRGVPQGSRLGPILFIFYINDVFQLLLKGELQLFADDAALKYRATSLDQLYEDMQSDLVLIGGWLRCNHLLLNVAKCRHMVFSRNSMKLLGIENYGLNLDGVALERASTYKYLGLVIDDGLKWAPHVAEVGKKISPYIFVLNRTRHFISRETATLIYFGYIYPHLGYLAPVWRSAIERNLQRLRVLQHRALKAVFKLPRLTPSASLFTNRFLSLDVLAVFESLVFIFRVVKGLIRNSFNILRVSDVHSLATRQSEKFYLEKFETGYAESNVIWRGLAAYNDLPNDIKLINNLLLFKNSLRKYLMRE